MREKMQKINNQRSTFIGHFVRFGQKSSFCGPPKQTILLRDIKNIDGEVITDHLWFNFTLGFWLLGNLQEGDIIQFDARVKTYFKGYHGHRVDIGRPVQLDYKLSHPTNIKILDV